MRSAAASSMALHRCSPKAIQWCSSATATLVGSPASTVTETLGLRQPIVSIDGIALSELDFVDIGALLETSGAVPVVVKSLVFPASIVLGRPSQA